MLDRTELKRIRRHANNRFPNRTTINIFKLLEHIDEQKDTIDRLRETISYLDRRDTSCMGHGLW